MANGAYGANDKPIENQSGAYGANDTPADAPETKSGILRTALGDKAVGFASGAIGATKAIADAAGAGNSISTTLDDVNKGIDTYLSPEARADQQKQSAIMDAAKGQGIWEGVKAAGKAFAVAPVQTTIQGMGSIAPVLVGGLAGLPGAAAVGTAMGAGTAKGAIFDDIKQRSLAAGMSEADATTEATKAQEYGGANIDQIALGGALGAADSLTGVNRIAGGMIRNALGKPAQEVATNAIEHGLFRRAGMGMLGEMPLEAAQGGQEQVAANVAAQRAGYNVDTWEGVPSKAAFEALASAGPGAAFGAMERAPRPLAPASQPTVQDVNAANADLGQSVDEYLGQPAAPLQLETNRVIAVPRQDGMGMAPIDRAAGPLSDAAADAQESGLTESMANQVGPLLKSYATPAEAEAAMMQREDYDRLEIGRHPRATDRYSVLPKSALKLEAQDAKASLAAQKAQAAEQKQMETRAATETRTQQAEQEDGNAMPAGAENAATTIERAILDSEQNTPQAPVNTGSSATESVADTVDEAAHAAATSDLNDRPQPTDAQKSAGNYAKGHIRVGGLDMAIENPVGSTRSGTDASGKPWTVTMGDHYGYIKATTGNDKDQVDTFVKRGTSTAHAGPVFVVDQVDPATGRFDEHKALIGYENEAEATAAYKANYAKGWTGMKAVTTMSMDQFKAWVKDGPKRLPASQDARVQEAQAAAQATAVQNAPQAAQAVAEEAAQAEVAQSTGKQSTPRLDRIAGETNDAYLARRAAAVNAKRASAVQTESAPTQSKDTAAAIEALGDKATGKEAAVPVSEMPDQTEAKDGEISKQSAAFINHVSKLFGKRVVFVSGMSADGMRTAGNVIYLSTESSVAHLRVLGHEMLHALKAQNAKSYNHMMDAVKGLLTDEEYAAQYKDYYGKDVPEGAELSGSERAFLAEEWMADLSGNRFAEEGFWKDVFTQVEAKHGTEAAKGIVAKLRLALVNALQKLMKLVNGPAFNVDARVAEHLDEIRKAIGEGFAEYAMAVKNGQLESEVTGESKFSEEKRQYKLDVNREERGTASRGQISLVEVKAIADAATKLGLDKARTAALVESAKEIRKRFPVKEGWAPIEATGVAAKKDDAGNIKVDKKGNPQVSVTWRPISYSFNVPAGKERAGAKMDMALVDKVADQFTKLVDGIYSRAAEGNKNAQIIVGHQTWYRNVAAILRREFGAQGDLFADLLGATSPNTPVDTNWRFAVEILKRFSKGEFDTEMKAFIKHMDEGGSASKFPGQKIRQASEKLYGMNSTNSMLALSNLWRAVESGTAPKARNFALNLIGQSNMATIDVWAARMLRRAADAVRGMNLPRIPTVAEQGVTGTWNASASAVTGEFGFGAAVLDKVSQTLAKKGIDLSPPDLQALAWFAEKELWTEKNWTSAQGEGGSFEENIESTPTSRYLMGFSVQQGDVQPEESAVSTAQARLLAQLRGDDSVISARVLPTYGMFMGKPEEALDLEWTVKKGEHNPAMLMAEAASIAKERTQMAIFVSRVLAPDESHPNARPGAEVYFKKDIGMDRVKAVMETFTQKGLDGFTLAVDPRAKASARPGQEFIGLRIQYVPEFDGVSAADVNRVMAERKAQLDSAVADLSANGDVAFAAVYQYDTDVVSGENYDEYIDRGTAGADSQAGGQPRSGQSVRERLEGAAARIQSDAGTNGPGGVSDAGGAVPEARLSTQRTGDGSGREEGGRTARGQVQTSERAVPQEIARLPGAPDIKGFQGPDPRLVSVAEQYARSIGISLKRQAEYVAIDESRAKRLAAAYEAMPHAPQDPKVKEAYQNLIEQTVAQYRALESAGYKFWLMDMSKPDNVEYASTPWNAMRDIRANKEMGVFPTDDGFGSSASFDPANNPLLEDTGIKWPSGSLDGPKKRVLANDLFRAVHDAFGHGLEGSGFRAQGEENAWQAHARLFTGSALGAITSETRGQNSWLNFGPHGEANQTAKVEDTIFADQKTGLMPEWTWTEGRVGDAKMSEKRQDLFPEEFATKETEGDSGVKITSKGATRKGANVNSDGQQITATKQGVDNFWKWFGDSAAADSKGRPLVMYHSTNGDFDAFEPGRGSINSTTFGDVETQRHGVFMSPDKKFSQEYLRKGEGQNVMQVYSSIQNPIDLREGINGDDLNAIIAAHGDDGKLTHRDFNYVDPYETWTFFDGDFGERFVAAAKAAGFDGAIMLEAGPEGNKPATTYVAFDANQIKSATGNRGSFSTSNNDIRFSEKRNTEPFYSALSKEVGALKMQTAPAFGWRDAIKGLVNKGQVKAEEIEWSGLNDWLTLQTGKVTRDQVVQYLDQNGVKVTEATLGSAATDVEKVNKQIEPEGYTVYLDKIENTAYFVDPDGDVQDYSDLPEYIQKIVDKADGTAKDGPAKFEQYKVPGGENYREVLLTLPDGRKPAPEQMKRPKVIDRGPDENGRGQWDVVSDGEVLDTFTTWSAASNAAYGIEQDENIKRNLKWQKEQPKIYQSGHWDQPNVLAHLRLDDRTDADGNKVLFVQEVQSDWGQTGKKEGFAKPPMKGEVRVQDGYDPKTTDGWEVEDGPAKTWAVYWEDGTYSGGFETKEAAEQRLKSAAQAKAGGVPSAPFVQKTEGWLNLALKRVIKMAVDGGYDKVAFATGQQSADHYDLSKHVSEIKYNVTGDSNYHLEIQDKRGSNIPVPRSLDADGLEQHVGKEIAQKIVDTATSEHKLLRGLSLTVGGEGMKTFYDKIVPIAAGKLAAKLGGGKLETVALPGQYSESQKAETNSAYATGTRADVERVKLLKPSDMQQPGFTITDKMREAAAGGLPMFSTRRQFDIPLASGFDDVVYKMQDKLIDTKRVIEAITKSAGKIADNINVYLQEELFHGRAAKRVADFGSQELKPLMGHMRLAGLDIEAVEEYLHARHAKEANALIASREPSMPDGGSGMTNKAAADYMAALAPAQRVKLEGVAKRVDAILAKTRQTYADYGLESQQTVDAWGSMFKHYIPLMREDKDGSMGIGQGFSVKGKEVKGRTGSTRKVVDILANIAMQRERAIVRGEKNRVGQALLGLAQANPNPDFWTVRSQAPTERVYDEKTKKVVDRPDMMFKQRDSVLGAKVKDSKGNVVEQFVEFNESDDRAKRMAVALKNLDANSLEGLLGVSAKITRYFSSVNTQYNPVFGVVNLVRDVQGAMINLGSTPLAGKQAAVAKDTLAALAGIYGDIRKVRKGGMATSKWATLWEQMQADGGTTGYRDLFKTSEDRANALKDELNPDAWMDSKLGKALSANGALKSPLSTAKSGSDALFGWLSDYNEAMENGVRLAAYKAALDAGMSRQQAASLSKNLTVNFNRKGQIGQQAGALYAFFNAAMQGTAKIGQTLFDMDGGDVKTLRLSPLGKKVVYGGILLGSMQALALAAAGFSDEDPPEFLRERSLIIPTGGKGYVSIPMPLGLHVIPGLGRHATEFALSGFTKPAKRAVSVFGMFADAFNPIGNSGLSIQTIAPTAIDPLVALTENKDWTGKPIARVSSNKALPGHSQWKDTATGWSKLLAEGINAVSGGNQYVAGVLSPTPDQIDYLIAQATGGVGREISKIEQTTKSLVRGEELPTFKIPLAGRFYGNSASQASEGTQFYANADKLNELETEIKGMRKDGKHAEANALLQSRPESRLIMQVNHAELQVQKLKREKREIIATGGDRALVRAKEEQITALMARTNRAAELLMEH